MESTGWASQTIGPAQSIYRGNGGAGVSAPTPMDESASRIRDAVGMAEETLAQLHATIDRLEKRLDTVLTPTPPTVSGAEAKQPQPVNSHLLSRIGSANTVIMQAIDRLNRIAQRIEI